MSPLHAIHVPNDKPQFVLDDIDRQFQLAPEILTQLSKAFLDEIKVGLGNYNHPMAMVYAMLSKQVLFLMAS